MEESINSIVDNVFQYVSINEQENVAQWKKDKEEFKDQLMIEINSIQDKEIRSTVLARLIKSSENENGKKFVNANGTVNLGKVKDSTKTIQAEVEKEIIAKREKEQRVTEVLKDTIKDEISNLGNKEALINGLKKEFGDLIPKDWSEEEQIKFFEKKLELRDKIPQYKILMDSKVPEDEARKQLGISEDDKEMFYSCLREEAILDEQKKIDEKIKSGTASNADIRTQSELSKKRIEEQKKQLDEFAKLRKESLKGQQSEAEKSKTQEIGNQLSSTEEGMNIQSETSQDMISLKGKLGKNETSQELNSHIQEIVTLVLDNDIDSMEGFAEIVDGYLSDLSDDSIKIEVSKKIEQLTQSQSLGDSGKSLEELIESGELTTEIIDDSLKMQEEQEASIQESTMNTTYIEKSEPIAIDPKWERMCQEAQERGETLNGPTLERLLGKYMQEEGLEQVENPKNPPSALGEKAGEENELTGSTPPVVENPEVAQVVSNMNPKMDHNLQENGEDRAEDDDKNSVERREYADKDGKNKRTVLITNDSNGEIANVQVFKTLIANVRMGQIEEEMQTIGQLATVKDNNKVKQEESKEDQEDVLE